MLNYLISVRFDLDNFSNCFDFVFRFSIFLQQFMIFHSIMVY